MEYEIHLCKEPIRDTNNIQYKLTQPGLYTASDVIWEYNNFLKLKQFNSILLELPHYIWLLFWIIVSHHSNDTFHIWHTYVINIMTYIIMIQYISLVTNRRTAVKSTYLKTKINTTICNWMQFVTFTFNIYKTEYSNIILHPIKMNWSIKITNKEYVWQLLLHLSGSYKHLYVKFKHLISNKT